MPAAAPPPRHAGSGVDADGSSAVAAAAGTPPSSSRPRRRTLNERERLIHAPMSDLGGLLYDRDAVYITLPDWKVSRQEEVMEMNEADG